MREADILTALASGPLPLRGIADKTGSPNGLKEKLLKLAKRHCVRMRPTGREHRYTITKKGLQQLVKHCEDTTVFSVQTLADIISLNYPTDQENIDFYRQLIPAMTARNDEVVQQLATHPASIKVATFSKALEATYSAFCKVHSLPTGIYLRVNNGKVEPLPQEYLAYLEEEKQSTATTEPESQTKESE